MTRRSTPLLLAAGLFAVGGCGAGDATTIGEPVFALDRDVAAQIADAPADRGAVMAAFDLRLLLQSLLTDHATLSNEAMRRAIDGGAIDSTLAALTDNTDQLTLAMGIVYGPSGANAFDQLWTNHIEFFNTYARAIAAGDTQGAQEATDALDHYEHDFSDFVDVATVGELGFETVLHVLHSHVDQLLLQADLWDRADHEAAIEVADEAFRHMDTIAAALAGAIAAQQPAVFPGDVDDPGRAICSAARLDVAAWIVARADVSAARRLGPGGYLDAAVSALEVAETAGAAWLEPAERESLDVAFSDFEDDDDPTTVRSRVLGEVLPAVTSSSCASVVGRG